MEEVLAKLDAWFWGALVVAIVYTVVHHVAIWLIWKDVPPYQKLVRYFIGTVASIFFYATPTYMYWQVNLTLKLKSLEIESKEASPNYEYAAALIALMILFGYIFNLIHKHEKNKMDKDVMLGFLRDVNKGQQNSQGYGDLENWINL